MQDFSIWISISRAKLLKKTEKVSEQSSFLMARLGLMSEDMLHRSLFCLEESWSTIKMVL